MAIDLLRDPRRHLLTVMAVALIVVVPLVFVFVTMTSRLFQAESGVGTVVLWALLGIACGGLLVGLTTIFSRATRQAGSGRDEAESQVGKYDV